MFFLHTCATCSKLPANISTIVTPGPEERMSGQLNGMNERLFNFLEQFDMLQNEIKT